jgi:hypothetical protein
VPQDSAILPGYIPIGIHSDHMGMTKFDRADDPGFVSVCGELRRWVRDVEVAKGQHADPSLTDSDLDKQPAAAKQYGNNNRQYNNFGNGTLKQVDGDNYEAKGGINFGMIPPQTSVEGKGA